jgi:hypothetical protein
MKDVIIVDNSPQAYSWQTENGLPIISWFEDPRDDQLRKLVPVLERLAQVEDVREFIPQIVGRNSVNFYEALRALKAPREESALDSVINSLTKFFSGTPTTENQKKEEYKVPKTVRRNTEDNKVSLNSDFIVNQNFSKA